MRLTIELPDEEGLALQKRAQMQGVSAEAYVRTVLNQNLKKHDGAQLNPKLRHISEVMAEILATVPPETPE